MQVKKILWKDNLYLMLPRSADSCESEACLECSTDGECVLLDETKEPKDRITWGNIKLAHVLPSKYETKFDMLFGVAECAKNRCKV